MEREVDPGEGHDAVLMRMARLSEALSRFLAPLESGEMRQRRVG
jgi:homoserine acetyltransferase